MTATKDPMAAYIAELHEKFDRERETIRTRSIALGYAFASIVDRLAAGDHQAANEDASAFADFYEQHTDGNWADLPKQYAAFQSRKDTPK